MQQNKACLYIHSFMYYLWLFSRYRVALSRHRMESLIDSVWPTKPKILIIKLFTEKVCQPVLCIRPSQVALWERIHLPMQETQVRSLGWEGPLEKETVTHSSIVWKIPWTEEPGELQSMGSQKSWTWLSTRSIPHKERQSNDINKVKVIVTSKSRDVGIWQEREITSLYFSCWMVSSWLFIVLLFYICLKCCMTLCLHNKSRKKYSTLLTSLPLVCSTVLLFPCSYLNKGNNAICQGARRKVS